MSDIKLPENIILLGFTDKNTTCRYVCAICRSEYSIIPKNIRPGTKCKNCHEIKRKKEISNDHLEVLEYHGESNNAKLICRKCKYEWEALPRNVKNTTSCPKCPKESNRVKKEKTLEFEYVKITFTRVDKEALACCKKCNFQFKMIPRNVSDKTQCPQCKRENKYDTEYVRITKFNERDKKCEAECKECEYKFDIIPKNMKKDKVYCNRCRKRDILKDICEMEILELIEKDYNWESNGQFTFKCKGKRCGKIISKSITQLKKGCVCKDTCEGNILRAENLVDSYGIKKVFEAPPKHAYDINHDNFIWICENGHRSKLLLSHVKVCITNKAGKWCTTCHSDKSYIRDGSFLNDFIKEYGLTRLTKTYEGLHQYHSFECKNNHRTNLSGNEILKIASGKWKCDDCPEYITIMPMRSKTDLFFPMTCEEAYLRLEHKYFNEGLSWYDANSFENATFVPSKDRPVYIPRHKPPQPKPTKEEIEAKRQDDKDEERHDKEENGKMLSILPLQRAASLANARGVAVNEEEKRGAKLYVRRKNGEEKKEKQRIIAEETAKRIEEKTKKMLKKTPKKDGKKYNVDEMIKKELKKDIGEDNETKDEPSRSEDIERSSKKVRKMFGFSEEHLADRLHAQNVKERMRTREDELNSREDLPENKQEEIPVKIEGFIYDEAVTTTHKRVFEALRGRNPKGFDRMFGLIGLLKRDIIELVVNYGFKDVGILDRLWDTDEIWKIDGKIVKTLDMEKLVFDSGNMNREVIMWCIEKSGSNLTFEDIKNRPGLRDRERWHEEMRKKTEVYRGSYWRPKSEVRPPPRYAHLDDPPETQEGEGSVDVILVETTVLETPPIQPKIEVPIVNISKLENAAQPAPRKIRFRVVS